MNAKQVFPIVAALSPEIISAVPPLLIIGGLVALAAWLLSDDDKKKPEDTRANAAPESKPLPSASNSGGNSGENCGIPANSGGKSFVLPTPSAIPANSASAVAKIPVQATSSTGQAAPATAAPAPQGLRAPLVSGGNTVQNRPIPLDAVGKPSAKPAPVNRPAGFALAVPKIPVPVPSVIPVVKAQPEISSPVQKKIIRREDMAKIFNDGNHGLTRKSAVAALKALGFGKTAAYAALSSGGRFASWLQFAPDGIITWKN